MKPAPLAVLAIAVGIANGLVFLGFEWLVNHGDDWIWNDAGDSDAVRWHVIPLAIGLSIVFSALLRAVGEPRWTPPHLDPLAETSEESTAAPAFSALVIILAVGAASLLAGASLGPEAPLFATATGFGVWLAANRRLGPLGGAITLASVGALLVAFFGSLIGLAIPLLILRKRTGALARPAVAVIVVAGLAAYGTLWLVQGNGDGYGGVPPSLAVRPRDYAAALVLGGVAVGVGVLLRWFVMRLATVTAGIDRRTPWWLAAAIFGAVLGGLYLLGGPTVEFSGSEGSSMLLSGDVHYATWALAGLALVKLVATSWSLASGYRGGLVFPSVFAGVAVSLFAAAAVPDFAGPGVLLGSVAGLLVEMTAPVIGAVMVLALLPLKLLPLGLVGAAGAVLTRRFVVRG